MGRFSLRKKTSFIKRHKILVFSLVIILVYVGVTLVRQEIKMREYYAKEKFCQEKIFLLQEEVEIARQDLDKISSAESIERIAREKLKMVKPNEIIYIIQEDEESVEDVEISSDDVSIE